MAIFDRVFYLLILKNIIMTREQILKEIKSEMLRNGSWGNVAYFKCFSDNIFTYQIENDGIITELNIIADDMFFAIEKPIELLSKKRIGFLSHSIYIRNGNKKEKIGSILYKPFA